MKHLGSGGQAKWLGAAAGFLVLLIGTSFTPQAYDWIWMIPAGAVFFYIAIWKYGQGELEQSEPPGNESTEPPPPNPLKGA